MDHLERFGLERDPFRSEPQLEFWFSSQTHVAAGKRLRRCVEQSKELCALVGPVGSGTTTVLRALFEQLDADRFEMISIVPLRDLGPDELRARIARQLGVESPARERTASLRELYERLVALASEGRQTVIGIDEAHTLAPDAFGELRALLQLEHEDRRLLSLVLAGTPDLSDAIAGDTGLPGRVDLLVTLEPLSVEQAHEYLAHRLEVAGGDPNLLDRSVLDAIAARAAGLPRRLNALADATLYEAFLADHDRPDVSDVERAARDLPWASRGGKDPGATRDELLDASLGGAPIESLRDGDSQSFADLDIPEADAELDVAREIEEALAPEEDAIDARFTVDHTVREADFDAELTEGPDQTAPGAWQSPAPIDDNDTTASRSPSKRATRDIPPIPSEDELDDLFVDLVDEVEPER